VEGITPTDSTKMKNKIEAGDSSKLGTCFHRMERLVMPVLRHLIWLAVCISAIAAHHHWFGIGSQGIAQAVMDGAFLAVLVMSVVWIHGRLISGHNASSVTVASPTPTDPTL
jgi:hypothetical protein